MSHNIQQTKLFVPSVRPGLIERPRLQAILNKLQDAGGRLGLVSAPAGSGKTTLVVQWLQNLGWPAAWLALDERDNSPPRFFAYLIAAVQTVVPETGLKALDLLEVPGVNPEELITLLTNDLAQVDQPFVLVLDDFHSITNPQIHQALDFLIEAQPPSVRLVLITREDPVFPLARLRARAALVELRQADLRFTREESAAFLSQVMGLSLSSSQEAVLEERTEGWISGLQLAALSLQHHRDVERFLEDFSGSHRFILDYLVEEVLANQPETIQTFLLATSVLEQMCAGLCAALSGRSERESQKILDDMMKANLFLIPLDEERRWYRYHHLFRDLLQARLQSESSLDASELGRRAADWCEANEAHRQAVEYALRAGDMQRAADLIERHISERWKTVDIEFHLLIERLPFEVVSRRPSLSLQSAWLHVILGQAERVLPFVEAAENALDAAGRKPQTQDGASRAFARALRAYLADLKNLPVALGSPLEKALEAIPEGNIGMRNSVAVVIGTIYHMEGDFAAALSCFQDALALDMKHKGTNAVPVAAMRIALTLQTLGRLHEAMRRLLDAESYVQGHGIRRFYISGAIKVMKGSILMEWNRLEEAEDQIQEGLRLLEDWPNPASVSLGLSLLARISTARGELEGAQDAIRRIDSLQVSTRLHPIFLDAVEGARVRLMIARQDLAALEAWAEQNERLPIEEMRFRCEAKHINLSRAWLALGRSGKAVSLLERLAEAAADRSGSRVTILALLSAAHSQETAAVESLEEALRAAQPEGYLRTFLELGEPLQQRLKAWLKQGDTQADPQLREYARKLLAAFDSASPTSEQAGLPEPLSPRELEVLRLVAEGMTNKQIAGHLFISIRTVKKHVQNILGKLGVQNRTEAAARARAAGLLDL